MRKVIYIIIIVAITFATLTIWRLSANKEILSFKTTKAVKGDISSVITATGSLEAITTVEVGTQVSGIIQNIFVDFNSRVKSGQTIAILDTIMLHSSLQSANAELEQKSANLEYYKKNYERIKLLFESKTVAESEYDQAKWNYSTAKSNYLASKASLEKAQVNLNYATITSPINGVVISRNVVEGQTVAASFSTPTLFTIAQDLTKMQVVANIDEADIGQVKDGNRVIFSVDAFPDDEFEGKVIQIRLEPSVTQNVVTYNVLIDAPNPNLKLMPGMTANLNILAAEKKNIIKIQNKALRYSPSQDVMLKMRDIMISQKKGIESSSVNAIQDSGQMPDGRKMQDLFSRELPEGETMVWVKTGDFIRPKRIKIGLSDGSNIEVLEGLSEGEEVITDEIIKKKKEQESQQRSPFMPDRPGRK
ncbi:MAG TPA: efflux RND transporter periplasmic adaptor subunit [Bacteroidales bacterium]|nr:efflux RND transporter periplasmic adaptor subunit [Bacteroidales bacterium]